MRKKNYTQQDEDNYIFNKLKLAHEKWKETLNESTKGIINKHKIFVAMDSLNGAIKHCMNKGKQHFFKEFDL